MSTGISVAMTSVVASQAASQAQQALVDRCKATMPNFNAQGATVSEMKEYAECVETLYPTGTGADGIIVLKVLFVAALAGAALAVWLDRGDGFTDRSSQFLAGVVGFILAPLVVALVFGVWWLFS